MLDNETIASVVQTTKNAANPDKDLYSYTKALILASLDTIGYDSESLAFGEGVDTCIRSIVKAKNPNCLILDLSSILYLPEVIGDSRSDMQCVLVECQPSNQLPDDNLENLSQLINAGLVGHSDKLVGIATDVESARMAVGKGSAFQLRAMAGEGPLSTSFDYRMEYDSVWRAMICGDIPGAGLIVWNDRDCNEVGYIGDVLMPYENPLPLFPHLRSVVQLPQSMRSWLFCWSPEASDSVDMVDLSHKSLLADLRANGITKTHQGKSITVSDIAIAVNRNLCPKYYMNGKDVNVKTMALSELATKIQRGTGLTGKELDIIGTIYKLEPGKTREESALVSLSGIGSSSSIGLERGMYIAREKDFWYIDNSCIQNGGFVEPKLITSIPDGQARYTIEPDDGLCLLIPRNGKGISPFVAKMPTLVSDNLIIVRVNQEAINADYLSCISRSILVLDQIRNSKKPLTKDAVGDILIPILEPEAQEALIRRDKKIRDDIIELHNKITVLEMRDSFDVLESLGIEADRRAWKEEREGIEERHDNDR